ncbi:zinc-binding dehydrogenase [Actinomadura xylanilytica]|uniref:zinc-binding dehydrogenase n=1 Tax=Actinomadura xylanilytica TaxID=887459 RepID=UPI00255B3ABF|nr:zinc-binding dehydrogenase [Actinomadura xylanilytica]MDL4772451.1 hypothetical protein [Actinomadura xylanilytica]
MSGLTAFIGMSSVLDVTDADTVLVTGAAGTAGSAEKVTWVKDVAKLDACVDYRTDYVPDVLREFAPDGLTAVFENVGGVLLENALDRLAVHARIALCGSISSGYTATGYGAGPAN